MRNRSFLPATALAGFLWLLPTSARGQSQPTPPVPEEVRAFLKEVERAYKAPAEVDKDILDDLRKQYRDPKPDREADIFREVRRLYVTTPALEETILRELRRAYQEPTPEQEARFFEAVRRGGQLPAGTIPPDLMAERAARAFGKLDRNKDGVLDSDELPDLLRSQVGRWDRGRDGVVDSTEYMDYFEATLKSVAEAVAAGELPLKLPKGSGLDPMATPAVAPGSIGGNGKAVPAPPTPAAKLPDWFAQLDEDQDRQVGLYEWKHAGRPIRDYLSMDQNNDGYVESRELAAYLAANPSAFESQGKGRKGGR